MGNCSSRGAPSQRTLRLLVQRHGIACAWIEITHHRIVSCSHAIGMTRKMLDGFPALHHVAEVVDDREWIAADDVRHRQASGRYHHGSAFGVDPHHLQTVGMTSDMMQRYPRRNLTVAIVEHDAVAEYMTHHQRHVLGGERMAQQAVAHATPGGVSRSCK